MSKNKWWVSVLVGILILVVLVGAGYAVYRLGYAQGSRAAAAGQITPRNFQGLPNLRHIVPGLRGFERGVIPSTRAGGVAGLTWVGMAARIAITALVIIALVLLIIFLFGKLGSRRTLQNMPVDVNKAYGDQEQHQE